jgi:hypothetical protein
MTSNEVTPHRRTAQDHTWQTLIEFTMSREPGGERLAVERVAEAVQRLNWPAARLEQLKLALAQTAQKAVEGKPRYDSEGALVIRVLIPENDPATREADPANDELTQPQASEGDAQQAGRPPSRGWAFFLIEKALPASGRAGRQRRLHLQPEYPRPQHKSNQLGSGKSRSGISVGVSLSCSSTQSVAGRLL